MKSRDFAFWLQGYFEVSASNPGLTPAQVEVIKRHLALVFIHEIDPSMGDAKAQDALNKIHKPGSGEILARC